MNRDMPTTVTETAQHTASLQRSELCLIETQFPVSKLSKESYAERTAKQSQTLTGLGKWWGRKPLVLCRATILGLLLPATTDAARDREVFLRLMTMDEDGMLGRKSKNIPAAKLFRCLGPTDQSRYFDLGSTDTEPKLKKGITSHEKDELQHRVFLGLSYDEQQEYCVRPEQVDGPSAESWRIINAHLGTHAASLADLVAELGQNRFGHVPRVGDCFCGGGSVPFEAARIGCEAYGSDLNPVAALLTWAALKIVGGVPKVAEGVQRIQRTVFEQVDRQVTAWGIEHSEPDPKTGRRWRADAYLYCVEVTCPECNWRIPLASSWVIGRGSRTIARLVPNDKRCCYDFEIVQGVLDEALEAAHRAGTAKESELICPQCKAHPTPIRAIRGDGRGTFSESRSLLRGWENGDIVPRDGDVFGERLYCIRWVDTWTDVGGKEHSARYYRSPTAKDLAREQRVLDLLMEHFTDWQQKGFIPSRRIEPGVKTDEPIRTRGWTHWHHLFTPRQLLVNGLLAAAAADAGASPAEEAALVLAIGRCSDWNSRLCRWHSNAANEKTEQTFSNQALNTLSNFGVRPLPALQTTWMALINRAQVVGSGKVLALDARQCGYVSDLWITDPPYGDAIQYDELSEYFLAWYETHLVKLFPEWYADSKRALAVKGSDDSFRKAMVDCYRNMAQHMPDNGLQVVMFTHQDAGVWADLALILWAAGLRVTAAWCIATETSSPLKEGNYVQGTVLLILRKQSPQGASFLDEVYPEVETEVRHQLDSMLAMDDERDPSFADTDYQLAAYAAALRVLTSKNIEEIDVNYELTRTRARGEVSPVEDVIRKAVAIACDHLVPRGIDRHLWKSLAAVERLYLKGLEMESHGEYRNGVYQELARGFGVREYKPLLASTKANQTRLKTASEFGRKDLGGDGFGDTLVRHALFGVFMTTEMDSTREAITWFTTEIKDYASNRARLIDILEFLAALRHHTSLVHWHKDAEAAALLAGALRNRQDNV
ncbi:MAG: DUF1156 domain-containing protein [Chloroflexi bacterium]|nr:DUF1156 domain-containing protein [Chloroflexota bacterium]